MVLGVEAANETVGGRSVGHCQQARSVGKPEILFDRHSAATVRSRVIRRITIQAGYKACDGKEFVSSIVLQQCAACD